MRQTAARSTISLYQAFYTATGERKLHLETAKWVNNNDEAGEDPLKAQSAKFIDKERVWRTYATMIMILAKIIKLSFSI